MKIAEAKKRLVHQHHQVDNSISTKINLWMYKGSYIAIGILSVF